MKIILAILLFVCLLPMPYGYYQLLRFIAMLAFTWLAYYANGKGEHTTSFMYVGLAILFQPLIKIALGRQLWNAVDLIVGVGLFVSIIHNRITRKKSK